MSLLLDSYRRNAEAARRKAVTAPLANVRAQAAVAAERWTDMAERLEWVEAQHILREAATVPRMLSVAE